MDMYAKNKILKKILINPNTGCWEWQGYIDHDGYARTEVIGGKNKFVHRLSYEAFIESIPANMSIDHICRNKKCCNPKHLQILSIRENLLLGESPAAKNINKTHCKHGHIFDEENTRHIRGERVCKTCSYETQKRYQLKKKMGIPTGRKSPMERIDQKLSRGVNGCMVWTGATFTDGYGFLKIEGKYEFVHKAIYKEKIGVIPDGMAVYRECENKLCCAVEHMYLRPLGSTGNKERITLVKSGG